MVDANHISAWGIEMAVDASGAESDPLLDYRPPRTAENLRIHG
jgi:hypothetical protein